MKKIILSVLFLASILVISGCNVQEPEKSPSFKLNNELQNVEYFIAPQGYYLKSEEDGWIVTPLDSLKGEKSDPILMGVNVDCSCSTTGTCKLDKKGFGYWACTGSCNGCSAEVYSAIEWDPDKGLSLFEYNKLSNLEQRIYDYLYKMDSSVTFDCSEIGILSPPNSIFVSNDNVGYILLEDEFGKGSGVSKITCTCTDGSGSCVPSGRKGTIMGCFMGIGCTSCTMS